MKYYHHASDLYLLPETEAEKETLEDFIESKGKLGATWCFSNVEGQDWHGKHFIDIPFGSFLKPEIENLFPIKEGA